MDQKNSVVAGHRVVLRDGLRKHRKERVSEITNRLIAPITVSPFLFRKKSHLRLARDPLEEAQRIAGRRWNSASAIARNVTIGFALRLLAPAASSGLRAHSGSR